MVTSSSRDGFSLMEVLIATSILLASVIMLGELAGIGRRQSSSARELATAQILCGNKLNEILSGAVPFTDVDEEPVEEDPDWVYSVRIEPLKQADLPGAEQLVSLTVTVTPQESQRRQLETEHHLRKQFSLVRWVRSPAGVSAGRPQLVTSDVPTRARQIGATTTR